MIRKRTRRRLPLLTSLEPRLLFSTTITPTIDTTTQLSASTSAVLVGNSLTFTATVTPQSGGPLTGQWVQLWDNGTIFVASAQLTDDSATMTWTPRTGGLHNITAEFPAQDEFLRSVSGEADINVYRRAAQIGLHITTNGNQVHVTANATSVDPLSFAPTGSVQISKGSQVVGIIQLRTTDSLNFVLPPGTYDFHASYSGDGAFFPAQTAQNLVISRPPSAISDSLLIDIASLDGANTIKPVSVSFTLSGSSLLINPADQKGQTAFHLNSSTLPPEHKQFYESQLSPPLNPDDSLPAIIAPDQSAIPSALSNSAGGASAPKQPTALPPNFAVPTGDLPAFLQPDKLSKSP